MKNENYSHKFINSKTGDYTYSQIVLEMYVKPKCYETINIHGESSMDVDGGCGGHNHFRIKAIKYIYPKSILLRISNVEDMDNGNGNGCIRD